MKLSATVINSCMMGSFSFFLLSSVSADFFQNLLCQKNLSGTLSECQMVWILIWVLTVLQTKKSLLSCQRRVTVMSCFVYDIIRDL